MNLDHAMRSVSDAVVQWAAALLSGCALALWAGAGHAQAVDATPRMALVFGNAAYSAPDRPLKNPVSDARLMARTLKELGFDVSLREDADRRAMLQAMGDLEDKLRKTKGVGFVYFAGHGVQVQGRNYILPIGANLVRDTDAQKNAIDVDAVLQSLRDTGATLNILVLDACRNNPLLATTRSSGSGNGAAKPGLAPVRPPEGALVAFATEPGRLASDGKETGNGLYTRHLARWIKEPGLTLEQVFKRTREAVQSESRGDQIPTEYSVLTGADLYLAGTSKSPSAAAGSRVVPWPAKNAATGVGSATTAALASRSADASLEPGAPRPGAEATAPRSARLQLAQLGAGFTRQSYQLAVDHDDVAVFELLMASGWDLTVWDLVRIMDPRESLGPWPAKIMALVAAQGKNWAVHADFCNAKNLTARFNRLPDVWATGYDSPAMDSTRVLFERSTFNQHMAERRMFYQQLCGAGALASR